MTSKVRLKVLYFIFLHQFLLCYGDETAKALLVNPPPEFKFVEEPPATVWVRRGEKLVLPCSGLSGDGATVSVQWYRDQTPIAGLLPPSKNDDKIISHDLNNITLIPHKRRRFLSGNYSLLSNGSLLIGHVTRQESFQCFISASKQKLASSRCHVILYDSPSFSVSPTSQSKGEGECLRFYCRSAASSPLPPLSYLWLRDNVHLPLSKRYVVLPGVLQILNATSSDTGQYSCHVNNTAETAIAHASLSVDKLGVAKGFEWVHVTRNSTVERGNELLLECLASCPGHKITYTWMHKGTEFCTSDKPCNMTNGNLRIPHTSLEYSGIFECVASCNNTLYHNKTDVIVYSKPKIEENSKLLVGIGTNKGIRCKVDANPPAQVWWMRNGNKVSFPGEEGLNERVYAIKKMENEVVLMLASIKHDFEGLYQCVAQNKYGYSIYTVNVTVTPHRVLPALNNFKISEITKDSVEVMFSRPPGDATLVRCVPVTKQSGVWRFSGIETGQADPLDCVNGTCMVHVEGLKAYTNYSVFGLYFLQSSSEETESIYFQTSECVPTKYATKDKIVILGPHELIVSWAPLTGPESCGRIIYYTVEYSPLNVQNPPRLRTNVRVTEEMRKSKLLYVHLTNLQPDKEYHISVMPATRLGAYEGASGGDEGLMEEKLTSKISSEENCRPSDNDLQVKAKFIHNSSNDLLVTWQYHKAVQVARSRLSLLDYVGNLIFDQNFLPQTERSFVIPDLDRLEFYKVTLQVYSTFNKTCLNVSTAVFPGAKPAFSTPTIVSLNRSSTTEIFVRWEFNPKWYPDQPIHYFEIQCLSKYDDDHFVNSTTTEAKLSGLKPGTLYEISVRAVFLKSIAERGATPFSAVRADFTKWPLHQAPTRLVVVVTEQNMDIKVEDYNILNTDHPRYLLKYNCVKDNVTVMSKDRLLKSTTLQIDCAPVGTKCHLHAARINGDDKEGKFRSKSVEIVERSEKCGPSVPPTTAAPPRDNSTTAALIGCLISLSFILVIVLILWCCCRREMMESAKCLWCKKSATDLRHCSTKRSTPARPHDNRCSTVVDSSTSQNNVVGNGHIANGHGPGHSGKNGFHKQNNEVSKELIKAKHLNGMTNHKRPSTSVVPLLFNKNLRKNGAVVPRNNQQCYLLTSVPIPAHSKLLRQGSIADTSNEVPDVEEMVDMVPNAEESLLSEIDCLLFKKTTLTPSNLHTDYDVTSA